MNTKTFKALMEHRLEHCEKLLISKGKEYNEEDDRFKSFRMAGLEQGCSSVRALDGMWSKHRVSIQQEIRKMEADPTYIPSDTWIKEKLTDNINYTVLLEGLIRERKTELREKEKKTNGAIDIQQYGNYNP